MSSTAWLSNSQWETSILNKQPIRSASAKPTKQRNTIGQYTNNYRPIRDVRGQLITAGFKVQNQLIAECVKGRNQLNTECINGQNQQNTERMNGRNQPTTDCINNCQNQRITESIHVRNQQTTECINDRIQQITECSNECENQETTEYINDRNQQTTECMKGRIQKTIECINRRNQLITKNFKVRNQPITECLEAQQIPESVRVENQPIPACIKNPNQLVTKCLKSQPITDCVLKIAVTVCLVLAVTVPPTLAEIRVGGAVNVFSRFGYLSISMRVVPRNDSDHTWIFREPIVDVFKQVVIRQSLTKSGSPSGSHPVFQGDFHMEFCDNIRQLLQAYFRDFTIEKMEHPWQAFTSSWSPAIIARNLGIDASHVTGDNGDRFCFVLVRVARHRESAAVASDAEESPRGPLQDAVAQQMARVKVGDAASVGEFVRSFGSHYVASYTTGNSLYQVFVYTPIIYKRIKDRLKSRGITSLSTGELNSYFSPWYAEHTGKVLSASGNSTMEKWALQNLRVSFYFFNYPSLLKIHGDTALLKQLNTLLQNEALLQLELKTLAPAFDDEDKRKWFEEVVENNMILWDVNM